LQKEKKKQGQPTTKAGKECEHALNLEINKLDLKTGSFIIAKNKKLNI